MLFKPSFKEGHYKYISNEYNHNPHSANWAPLFQSTQRLPAGILIIKQKRSSSSKVCLIVKCCKILVLQSCYAVIWYDCLRYEHDVDWAYLGVTDSSFICIMSHHLSHISSEQVIICVKKKIIQKQWWREIHSHVHSFPQISVILMWMWWMMIKGSVENGRTWGRMFTINSIIHFLLFMQNICMFFFTIHLDWTLCS